MFERDSLPARHLLVFSLRTTLSSISLWIPALALLLPTLLLQLAVPSYLRTRLSPSPWLVIGGSLTLLFLTQIVMPSIFAMVHARRTDQSAPSLLPALRVSIRAGTRSFLGLVLGVIPGIWLQARYAFAAMPAGRHGDGLASSAEATRGRRGQLMFCAVAASWRQALRRVSWLSSTTSSESWSPPAPSRDAPRSSCAMARTS